MSKKTLIVGDNKTDANYLRLQNKIAELEQQIEKYKQLAERLGIVNKKLAESEARFKMISDYSNDWEVFRDVNNEIIYCSPSVENLLGYSVEEFITKVSFTDYVYPDDFQFAFSEYERLAKGELPSPVKFRLMKKTGEIIWVETSGQPIFTSNGEYIGFRTSTRDITDHKMIELALKESEEKYKKLFQFMDEGVIRTDKNGYLVLANDAYARMAGYDAPSDIIGKHITILYPALTRAQMIKELDKSGYLLNYEILTKTKQGEDIYVLCNFKNLVNKNGEIEYREGIVRDITGIKKIELALKESEEKYKKLFQFMDEGVLRTDKNGYIILANNAFARMFGYDSPSNLIGEHITLLYPVETRAQMIKELDKTGHLLNYEILTKTKQGEDIYVFCNFKNIFNENGEVEYREGIIRDITDLKNIEFALRNSEAKLIEANSTKDKFISILAHDLKNPFNSLIGFSDLLKEEVENYSNDNLKKFVNIISDVSTNTYFLLEELLEWARTQQNLVAFNPENIQVFQIVDECISLLSNASATKNIRIDCNISQDLYVFADRNMLKTILRNLISNAIKFTSKFGQIRILASIKQPYIEIIVSDTGIGMDTNTLESLFKIDKTKSVKGTEGERGTGFGLLLCKEFVEKHGGTISIKSKLGFGSDFKITMPIKLD